MKSLVAALCIIATGCPGTVSPDATGGDASDSVPVDGIAPEADVAIDGSVIRPHTIAAGELHACAIANDRTVRCWGGNAKGQLGDGTTSDRSTPVTVPGLSDVSAIAAAADGNTCALRADGSVWCWGANANGQVGDGTMSPFVTSPVRVTGIASATAIAAGGYFACALLQTGAVDCWGTNETGELGDGTTASHGTPAPVSGLVNALAIGAGPTHACAILADGTVRCWGANGGGQLGDGTTVNRTTPVQVTSLDSATEITAGNAYTCARLVDGSVRCWGANRYGELGDGTTMSRLTPTPVPGLSALEVSGLDGVTCAVLVDRTLRCWGQNDVGQVGDGSSMNNRLSPVAVSGLTGVVDVAAGGGFSCALTESGTPWCWGLNQNGVLGDGTMTDHAIAAAVVWN